MKKLEVGVGNMRVRKGSIAVDVYMPKWAVEVPERFRLCNVEKDELPFGDGEFDEVVLKHVFEHFGAVDRRRVIEKCLRVLRPGGFLRIAVPNTERYIERYCDGLWRMEELSAMIFGAQTEEWQSANAHKVCYSQDSLKRFFPKLLLRNWR
jgi:predicted SAM-dependent methyltransferase